jgi:hypothetical protein
VELERKATVKIPSKNATLVGTIGVTDNSTTMETGTTYSPSTFGSVYFTYDISKGEGDWTDFQTGVDGGTVTFTAEPYANTVYRINTTAGETAEVKTGDFSKVDGSAEWTVDVSDQLETNITEVDSVGFYANVDETTYETVQIKDDFKVTKFEDPEGNTYQSADFQSSEPQSDSNYITQEQWDEMQEKNEELIEKYENAQNSGGGGWLDFGGGGQGGLIAAGVAVVAGIGAVLVGMKND